MSLIYKIQERQEANRGQSEVTSEAGPQVDVEAESTITLEKIYFLTLVNV